MTAHLNLERAARQLDARELDGLVASTPENVHYTSGLQSASFLLNRYAARVFAVVSRAALREPVVAAALGDAPAIADSCPPGTRAVLYGSIFKYVAEGVELTPHEEWIRRHVLETPAEPSSTSALAQALSDAGLARGRVGYDEQGLPSQQVAEVRRLLPGLELVPASDVFRSIRAVKSPSELERLTRSLELTEDAIEAAVAIAAPGVTESDMMREFARVVALGGGVTVAIDFSFGRRGGLGNPGLHDAELQEGDLIRFDGGCRFDGYYSDIARTFLYRGEVDASVAAKYRALQEGETAAIDAIRPGTAFAEVFRIGVEATRAAGLEPYGRHHIGHSIGLEIYDGAMISADDISIVESGMFLEVELPYMVLGFGGLQLEDTVLVGDDGPAVLTRLDRDIIRIEE
ncbi:MAG: Xaa-Pro peptidase family protein [Actinomycetota bacterium]